MQNARDEELAVEQQEDAHDTESSSSDEKSGSTYGSTAAPHSYLGEVDDVACNSVFLEEGSLFTLPLFYMEGIVLFPGSTLPMRLLDPHDKAAVDLAKNSAEAPSTLGVVHGRSRMSILHRPMVGTTAEIRQLRSAADGSVNIVAKGCQRFRTSHVWTNADGVVCAQLCIMSEDLPLSIPRDAFGKLARVLSFQSGKDPATSSEQKNNALELLRDVNFVAGEAMPCSASSHHESLPDAWENWGSGVVPGEVQTQQMRLMQERREHRAAHARQPHHNKDNLFPNCSGEDESSCSSYERRAGFRKRWALDASKSLSLAQCSAWPHWVYRMYDAYYLARRAADLWQQMVQLPSIYNLVKSPGMLAYHIASRIPVQDSTRQELLEIDGVVFRLQREIQLLESMNDLICRWCLALIARKSDILVMSAEGPVDAFVNNYGIVHETLTLTHTEGLILLGNPETEHSWFPGYSWTTAFCSVCKAHMGWLFKAVKRGLHPRLFWGIRRSQLAEGNPLQHLDLQRG